MNYLKLFKYFESDSNVSIKIIDDKTRKIIEDVFNECFYDYFKEYGAKALFSYGTWTKDFRFENDAMWADIVKIYPAYGKLPNCLACSVTILNDYWGTDRKGKLEVYTDANTNNLFNESIQNLKIYLDEHIDCEIEAPTKIVGTWYSITVLIKIIE